MTENVDERALLPLLVPDFAGLLEGIRSNSGMPRTVGLSDSVIAGKGAGECLWVPVAASGDCLR